jgi:hypothetical protein
MRLPAILLVMAFLLALAAPARAGDPVSALIDARLSLSQGKHAEAIARIREALVAIYQEAPLACQNVTWIAEAPTGYGRYKPRSSNVFSGVEPLILYLEPIGYSIVPTGAGYRYGLRADFMVLSDKNEPLGGAQDFARNLVETRSPQTEDFEFFTFNLRQLPPGKYKLQLTLKDQNSSKQVVVTKDLVRQ